MTLMSVAVHARATRALHMHQAHVHDVAQLALLRYEAAQVGHGVALCVREHVLLHHLVQRAREARHLSERGAGEAV